METARKPARQRPPNGIVWIEDYIDEDDNVLPGIASRLGIIPNTYRKWRMAGKGPEAFLLGKRVAARVEAINAWINAQEQAAQAPTDESRPPEPRSAAA